MALADNENIICYKELNEGYTHAENLHLFIKDVLKEGGSDFNKLEAIAVSKGPGSYTGLRIGVSAAKGLAYALKIPLISVDTLQIMTNAVVDIKATETFYCPMLDARRMEVYTVVYDNKLNTIIDVNALIVDENSIGQYKDYSKIYFFGDGMLKCKEILNKLPNANFIENIFPSSKNMVPISFQKFKESKYENVAYFEPYYLKEFFITSKKI